MDDTELARRSLAGFGELLVAFGARSADPGCVVRRDDVVGARLTEASGIPFFDAAIVPFGASPPADDARLPLCVWTVEAEVPGRNPGPELEVPCMGVALDDPALDLNGAVRDVGRPGFDVLGAINERAYGDESGWFGSLVARLAGDERVRTYGFVEGGEFVCVAMTLRVGDDASVHYVATEERYRRRGFASRLVRAVLADERDRGARTATLQASEDGLSVWTGLGFRRVATLRGYLRSGE